MKKTLFVAAAAIFSLASCKKDYTCECTTTMNGEVFATTSATITAKKKDAEASCNSGNITTGTSSVSCKLK